VTISLTRNEINLGLDIGSTTVKVIAATQSGEVVYSKYMRHFSEVRGSAAALLREAAAVLARAECRLCLTGSGALALSEELGVPFIQEVVASSLAIKKRVPDADVIIELGGEDAKLTYLTGGVDQRMNETCAGGTGAFIDQMAAFIRTDAAGLDALAQRHSAVYPIASRCGVFAKTDILPLLNEGASRENIAASIMQAVVNQTLSGLARGRAIRGKVVLLGGPLSFLPSLRECFEANLKEAAETVLPEHAQYFVAYGAALYVGRENAPPVSLSAITAALKETAGVKKTRRLPPFFCSAAEREEFRKRHEETQLFFKPLSEASGDAWLGFDSGSTTLKAVLLDAANNIIFQNYGPNKGDPLTAAQNILREIYAAKPAGLTIRAAGATGYGSALLASALGVDVDEVETVAHYKAASYFEPRVSFVLDIGGQDIKCMQIKDNAINRIQLNEACSAGCGSFIESFAESLGMLLSEFVAAALDAKSPADLGTRCTVFMNSKVKQMQKEGAPVGDIAAGLCYSVIRNACFKVMKLTNTADLGEFVVAQGGAFANSALLRALELELGRPVLRPEISGLMGAFGAALIARERGPASGVSTLITAAALEKFTVQTSTARCGKCTNHCLLTISRFPSERKFVSGNRCEQGAVSKKQVLPNLYAYKYKRLFEHYQPLPLKDARRGVIGIPRALNIFENYPLWFTVFTKLGFRVELSAPSSKELYYKGHETIPSQTVCYPAKLAHGHLFDLLDKGVKNIFFPCIPYEQKNFPSQDGTFNCPVVIGYPELLINNIGALKENGVNFIHEFLPLDETMLPQRLQAIPLFASILSAELEEAVQAGFAAMRVFQKDMQQAGEKLVAELMSSGKPGIVLAGHPYHIDQEVNHGIAEVITSCGMAVLTEDSVAHLKPNPGPLRVVDQWTYHSRLYRAGAFAAGTENIAVLQLISFGCGLDAITAEQLEEIVCRNGRLYAQIKIDEGGNLGPARIRVRSLLAAMREKMAQKEHPLAAEMPPAPLFTDAMRETHTILIPQMSPIHFRFMETIFTVGGYKSAQLPLVDKEAIDLGLRYVNNDACFPAIVVIGQLLQAIRSGAYDPHRVALAISQTGGGCRATNYIAFLRKALLDCGLGHVPIVAFSTNLSQDAPGFHVSFKMLRRMLIAIHYGDALMRMLHRVRPYEAEAGSAERLAERWIEKAKLNVADGNVLRFELNMLAMIRDFDRLALKREKRRPRVGLVGEILLKYHPDANNNAIQTVEKEGGEAVSTDIADFLLYSLYDHVFNYKQLAGSKSDYLSALLAIAYLEFTRLGLRLGFAISSRFTVPSRFSVLRDKVKSLISLGHQTGEGWLLTAEMVKMLESGINNILCMQPFGCLPNHITGKGLIKELKRRYAEANILAVDYDAGASEANQVNRIKLMMTVAKQEASISNR
jgi:predicted CoA-substrate-specific enzyme activase